MPRKMTGDLMRMRTVRPIPQAWGRSGDTFSGLDGAFCDPQGLMVTPGVLAGWAMGASFRGDGIAFRDDDARDAPFTETTGLTATHVNRRDARLGCVTVHRTLQIAHVRHMWEAYPPLV
jgi:hypothetical protein